MSLPAWGAWIEINRKIGNKKSPPGRSPHGERGLKSKLLNSPAMDACRSPHGERGLKYSEVIGGCCQAQSLPAWGAWIEIWNVHTTEDLSSRRSPHGERGLKSRFDSPSFDGAIVAPRMGSVD